MPRRFYLIYETTNLINGMKYRGQHTTTDVDDGYIGSGTEFKKAVASFGKLNFVRTILFMAFDNRSMLWAERIFVDREWVSRSDTYNKSLGGSGKGEWSGAERRAIGERSKKLGLRPPDHTGKPKTAEHRAKIGKSNRGKTRIAGSKNPWFGKGHLLSGASNPNSKRWRVINNKTGCVYETDDLVALCKSLNVPYGSIASSKEYKPSRTWFAQNIG